MAENLWTILHSFQETVKSSISKMKNNFSESGILVSKINQLECAKIISIHLVSLFSKNQPNQKHFMAWLTEVRF